jgi:hypothetical protein
MVSDWYYTHMWIGGAWKLVVRGEVERDVSARALRIMARYFIETEVDCASTITGASNCDECVQLIMWKASLVDAVRTQKTTHLNEDFLVYFFKVSVVTGRDTGPRLTRDTPRTMTYAPQQARCTH